MLDALDKCPVQPGTSSGCPQELRVLPTLRAIPTGGGIQVRSLSVGAPRGARVQVRCRRGCGPGRVRCRRGCAFSQSRTAGAQPVRFAGLRNRRLPVRARVEIFVTKSESIGSYIRSTVTRGNFKRIARCLRPGSRIPRRSCK